MKVHVHCYYLLYAAWVVAAKFRLKMAGKMAMTATTTLKVAITTFKSGNCSG